MSTSKTVLSKTEEQITQLAKDIWAGQVFCSWSLRENEQDLVTSIFMILGLMSTEQLKDFLADDPQLIYEYFSEAGPRTINGYPMFMSFQYLNKQEFEMLIEKYETIEKAMAAL